jgi:hypothetical protein
MIDKQDILDLLFMIRDKSDENATVERLIQGIVSGIFDISSIEELKKKKEFISSLQ